MAQRIALAVALATLLTSPVLATEAPENPLTDSATWDDLQFDIVGDEPLADASGLMTMKAPFRAHDAATVPIQLKQTDPTAQIRSATVIVDENPAPVAAVFGFSEGMGALDFELRVRVDQYSNVRVIAETPDGLHMTGRYVRASGGCSAPASGDPVAALASMGQMKLKSFDDDATKISVPRREAQIMIRHPNYSGLQRDQISQLFVPAHFINQVEVFQGEDLLFTMEGGISIAENPVFRFSYNDNGSTALTVKVTDTEGNSWKRDLPKSASS